MEDVILNLDNFSNDQIIERFGMIIPLVYANNKEQYIRGNIVSYAPILNRGNMEVIPLDVTTYIDQQDLMIYLNRLTDKEIFHTIGVYVAYNSRAELVRNTLRCIFVPQFMYPTIRSAERSVNKITTVGLNNINDVDVFMVCYGTALKYITYELYDLMITRPGRDISSFP